MLQAMKDIEEFHKKFCLDYDGPPRELPQELGAFRFRFMDEELQEYSTADLAGDLEGQLDALVDLCYVAMGTAYLQGFTPERFAEAWSRVHAANMSKVRTKREEDSKRGSTYDVVKPQGWTPPVLSDLCK